MGDWGAGRGMWSWYEQSIVMEIDFFSMRVIDRQIDRFCILCY